MLQLCDKVGQLACKMKNEQHVKVVVDNGAGRISGYIADYGTDYISICIGDFLMHIPLCSVRSIEEWIK